MGSSIYFFLITVLAVHGFFMNQQVASADSEGVDITLLPGAVADGAVCLDGSPPGYFYAEGSEEGQDNWLVALEGGGWCQTPDGCADRIENTTVGSTKNRSNTYFIEILSGDQATNPDFYNWNRVMVAYCDGSSFLGDVEEVDRSSGNMSITRRGLRIFDAVMEDLLARGMEYANMAILAGYSAGGLGAILHCDGFHGLLPPWTKVKCISDAWFFLHAENVNGGDLRANYFSGIVSYHGIAKSLPETCTSTMDPSLCIFPENIIKDIYTPLFILQAEFDEYQLKAFNYSNMTVAWKDCIYKLNCANPEYQKLQDFRTTFLDELQKIRCPPSIGIFVVSCYNHSLLDSGQKVWSEAPVLGNRNIATAVGDWFFDRSEVEEIDTNTVPHYCPK